MLCIHMLALMHIQSIGHAPAHIAMMFITVYIRLGRYLCVYTFVNITWSCVRPFKSQQMLINIGYILQFKKVDVSSCQGSYGPFGWARAMTVTLICYMHAFLCMHFQMPFCLIGIWLSA